jgi:YggT family protein
MTDALIYLVDTLLTLYLYVLILRFVMQLVRADFRNQIAHAVLTVTNPMIMPLRRIFPPLGKIDSASVLAIIIVAALDVGLIHLIAGLGLLDPLTWIRITLFTLIRTFISFFMGAIIIYAILSFVVPGGYSPPMALLGTICEPLLRPFRRIIPPIGNIDLSPLWACLALGVLLRLLAAF